jgi:hypothetical protein
MAVFPTVRVPAFEFQFNLVVYPLPATTLKTVSSVQINFLHIDYLTNFNTGPESFLCTQR